MLIELMIFPIVFLFCLLLHSFIPGNPSSGYSNLIALAAEGEPAALLLQLPFFSQLCIEAIILLIVRLSFAYGDQVAQTVFYIIGPCFPADLFAKYQRPFLCRSIRFCPW